MPIVANNLFFRCTCLNKINTLRNFNSTIIYYLHIIHMDIFLNTHDSSNDYDIH